MDVSHNPRGELEKRAAVPLRHLLPRGIDICEGPIEFAVAAHHFNGGVAIDENAASTVPGLFAAGETTGGEHGADRPGGNALASSQVFGHRAGAAAARRAAESRGAEETNRAKTLAEKKLRDVEFSSERGEPLETVVSSFRRAMWEKGCVLRTAGGLQRLLGVIEDARNAAVSFEENQFVERLAFRNALLTGEALARAALAREESRGTHFRDDFPDTSTKWQQQTVLELKDDTVKVKEFRPVAGEPL